MERLEGWVCSPQKTFKLFNRFARFNRYAPFKRFDRLERLELSELQRNCMTPSLHTPNGDCRYHCAIGFDRRGSKAIDLKERYGQASNSRRDQE